MTQIVGVPRRLHPATLVSRSVRIVPQMLGGGAAYAAVIAREGAGRILMFAILAGLFGLVAAFLVWWRFRYTVGDSAIVIESGVLNRQRRVIPYDRIQDISIERRLLARLFGTARVRIETGGSASDEGNLDMIALTDAIELRDHVRRGRRGEESEVAQAVVEEPVLFEMRFGRVLHSGLFNFSLVFLAALIAAAQYLDQFGIVDFEAWFTPDQADAAAGLVSLQVTLLLLVLLVLLGIVAGVARTIARDFGFRLTRSEAGLRRRRGLFTLSEVVIPIVRTQVAVVDSGPVSRWFGWYRLSFQTLGADRREGGVQVAAPFARIEEIEPILAEAGFPPVPPRRAFKRLPRRALWSRVVPPGLVALAAAAGAFLLEPLLGIAAAVMIVLGLMAVLRWRRHGHTLESGTLFVRSGLLRRRVWIMPPGRIQGLFLTRSPLERWLRLSTLLVDTAGASPLRAPEIVGLDESVASDLGDRLLALHHEARRRLRASRSPSIA